LAFWLALGTNPAAGSMPSGQGIIGGVVNNFL
jgi:hypothetical protein